METIDLIKALEFEYHAIRAANPDWKQSLWDFLESRGIEGNDIREHSSAAPLAEAIAVAIASATGRSKIDEDKTFK